MTTVALEAQSSLFSHAVQPQQTGALTYEYMGDRGLEGRLRVLPVTSSPTMRLGLDLMRKSSKVLLGMSPGNGYFSRKRVEIAVCGFAHLSGDVTLVVPDAIAIHTYRALGYSEDEGQKRVKKHSQLLKGRCERGIERSRVLSPAANLKVLDWQRDVSSHPLFHQADAKVQRLFETHRLFEEDILRCAQMVLESKTTSPSITASALREAANYLLKELAFISVCQTILGSDVVIPYHKPFVVGADFCDGRYGERVTGVGWAVYDIDVFDTGNQGDFCNEQ